MAPFKGKPTPAEVIQAADILLIACGGKSFDDPETQQIHDDFLASLKALRQAIVQRTT